MDLMDTDLLQCSICVMFMVKFIRFIDSCSNTPRAERLQVLGINLCISFFQNWWLRNKFCSSARKHTPLLTFYNLACTRPRGCHMTALINASIRALCLRQTAAAAFTLLRLPVELRRSAWKRCQYSLPVSCLQANRFFPFVQQRHKCSRGKTNVCSVLVPSSVSLTFQSLLPSFWPPHVPSCRGRASLSAWSDLGSQPLHQSQSFGASSCFQ